MRKGNSAHLGTQSATRRRQETGCSAFGTCKQQQRGHIRGFIPHVTRFGCHQDSTMDHSARRRARPTLHYRLNATALVINRVESTHRYLPNILHIVPATHASSGVERALIRPVLTTLALLLPRRLFSSSPRGITLNKCSVRATADPGTPVFHRNLDSTPTRRTNARR